MTQLQKLNLQWNMFGAQGSGALAPVQRAMLRRGGDCFI